MSKKTHNQQPNNWAGHQYIRHPQGGGYFLPNADPKFVKLLKKLIKKGQNEQGTTQEQPAAA